MMNTWLPLRRRRPGKVNSWRKTFCSPLVQEYNESNKRALLIPASLVTSPTRTEALKGTLRTVPALAVISVAVGFFALRSALSVPSDGRHTEFSLTEKYCCRSAADTAVTGRCSLGRLSRKSSEGDPPCFRRSPSQLLEFSVRPKMARVFAMGHRHPRESGGPGQPLQSLGPWIPALSRERRINYCIPRFIIGRPLSAST
jgi:hypothetical protein